MRWSLPPLEEADKPSFFSAAVINEMRSYFTDVYTTLHQHPSDVAWAALSAEEQALLTERYFDYLLRNRHTRRFLLDTNNLLLTREVDDATTLEPFKGIHRVLDVLAAAENLRKETIENERREQRVAGGLLGDPEVEKVTVVAAGRDVASLAALDGLGDEVEPPGDGD